MEYNVGDATAEGAVLIVDGDSGDADDYATWLSAQHDVRTARSGRAAHEALDEEVTLVVLGRDLSEAAAKALLASIRERDEPCAVAMVTTGPPHQRAADRPVDAVIGVPVTRRDIVETTAALVGGSGSERPAAGGSDIASGADAESVRSRSAAGFQKSREHSADRGTGSRPRVVDRSGRDTDLFSIYRTIGRALVESRCRDEAETAICRALTGLYDVVCCCEYTQSYHSVTVTTCEGGGDTEEWYDVEPDGPIDRAVSENAVTERGDGETAAGLDAIFDAVAEERPECQVVVPVRHRETVYGVLVLGRMGPVCGEERSLLTDLGASIGNGIDAIESKRLLVADAVTDLEFALEDRTDLFVDCAARHDCRISMRGVTPAGNGTVTCYVQATVTGEETVDWQALRSDLTERSAVVSHRVVDDCEETLLLEVTLDGGTAVQTLIDASARVVEFVAEGASATVAAEVAPCVDCRTVMEALESAFPATELVSKRTERPSRTSMERFRSELATALTDRQETILATAYDAGYFGWPRDSTAEEIAEAVDLSPPTVHEHLREAQRKVLEAFLSEVETSGQGNWRSGSS
jgi:predicted DNA binding protein